jgi:hypothetical protein
MERNLDSVGDESEFVCVEYMKKLRCHLRGETAVTPLFYSYDSGFKGDLT